MLNIVQKWSVNENLLQHYRSIFISSQSFIIAVGAIMVGKPSWIFIPIFLISLIMIWFIWFPVVKSRHRIVDYYKYSLELDDTLIKNLCTETEYVNDKRKRNEANKLFKNDIGNWRSTRIKVDLILPISFSVIWLILFINNLFMI